MSDLYDLRRRLEDHMKRESSLQSFVGEHARMAADFLEPEMKRLVDDRDAARKRADALEVSLSEQEAWSDAMEQRLRRSADRVQQLLAERCEQCQGNGGPTDE